MRRSRPGAVANRNLALYLSGICRSLNDEWNSGRTKRQSDHGLAIAHIHPLVDEEIRGRFVETSSGFHVEGTTTIDSHTVFTNGYYVNASGHAHFAFDTSFTSGATVFTSGGPEVHTIFNAEDEAVAQVKFVGVSHITYRDLNGNGQPDEGEITSSFERFHFICS